MYCFNPVVIIMNIIIIVIITAFPPCPGKQPSGGTICLAECQSDDDCKGNQICCYYGCHLKCGTFFTTF